MIKIKMKKENYMKLLFLLGEAQNIFIKSFKKPLKEIQQARERIISLINIK
jgi:hypothetical protein